MRTVALDPGRQAYCDRGRHSLDLAGKQRGLEFGNELLGTAFTSAGALRGARAGIRPEIRQRGCHRSAD